MPLAIAPTAFFLKSLHYKSTVQRARQGQAQLMQQDGLVLGGFADAAFADLLAAARGQDYIHRLDLGQFVQNFSLFIAQARGFAHLAKYFPQHVRQEVDRHMGLHPFFLLVPDRTQRQIAFVDDSVFKTAWS